MATAASPPARPGKPGAPSPRARRASRGAGKKPAPAAPAEQRSPAEQRARRTLIGGSALLLLGLAMVGVESSDAGAFVTLVGLLLLIFGVHSFGRLGPGETREQASS